MSDINSLVEGFLVRYSESTARAYGEDLGLYLSYCEDEGVDPLKADRPHVDGFARQMERRGNRASTVARRMSAVRGFYKVLQRDRIIEVDPAANTRMPRRSDDRTGQTYLDLGKMRKFLDAAHEEGPEAVALVSLMMQLGLRVSEACGVDLDDLRGDTLMVKRKGGEFKSVNVPEVVVKSIKVTGRNSGPAVIRKDGQRMDRRTAGRIVKRVAAKAGIEDSVSPHDLRAAYITLALDRGMSIYQVQDMAGHAHPSTTEIYDRNRRRRENDGNSRLADLLAV